MLSFIESLYVSELTLSTLQIISLDFSNQASEAASFTNEPVALVMVTLDLTRDLWLQSLYY